MLAQKSPKLGSYSADVRLELVSADAIIPLAQSGPDFVILAASTPIALGLATVIVHIDGQPFPRQVEILPHAPGDLQVPIRFVA